MFGGSFFFLTIAMMKHNTSLGFFHENHQTDSWMFFVGGSHSIHGTGIFSYISHKNQPFM